MDARTVKRVNAFLWRLYERDFRELRYLFKLAKEGDFCFLCLENLFYAIDKRGIKEVIRYMEEWPCWHEPDPYDKYLWEEFLYRYNICFYPEYLGSYLLRHTSLPLSDIFALVKEVRVGDYLNEYYERGYHDLRIHGCMKPDDLEEFLVKMYKRFRTCLSYAEELEERYREKEHNDKRSIPANVPAKTG